MEFLKLSDLNEVEPIPGFRLRVVHADNMSLAYWTIAAGAELPEHSHPHEQVTNLISGKLELRIGDQTEICEPGAIAIIPPNVPHSGKAIEECRVIDVFHPTRDDLR